MKTPVTFSEWLIQAIAFLDNLISSSNDENEISDYTIQLYGLKKAQDIYQKLLDNPNDLNTKEYFNGFATKIVNEAITQLDNKFRNLAMANQVYFPINNAIVGDETLNNYFSIRKDLENCLKEIKDLTK